MVGEVEVAEKQIHVSCCHTLLRHKRGLDRQMDAVSDIRVRAAVGAACRPRKSAKVRPEVGGVEMQDELVRVEGCVVVMQNEVSVLGGRESKDSFCTGEGGGQRQACVAPVTR